MVVRLTFVFKKMAPPVRAAPPRFHAVACLRSLRAIHFLHRVKRTGLTYRVSHSSQHRPAKGHALFPWPKYSARQIEQV
jgi:hypothetical protein